jgi:cyanophycinase
MTHAGPLSWRTGAGWLVLSGGGNWEDGVTGEIDAAVLGWANLDRPVVALLSAGSPVIEAEALLEYYADLGGPSGVLIQIHSGGDAQRAENCTALADAGLVHVTDGPDISGLALALQGSPALAALQQAFEEGAAVLGVGTGASLLGSWLRSPTAESDPLPGLGWVKNVIVEPHFAGTEQAGNLRRLLRAHPECLGLGIPVGAALGLGPEGRIQPLGETQATVIVSEPEETLSKE